MERIGANSLHVLDLIKVQKKHWMYNEIKSKYGTEIGLVVDITPIEHDGLLLSILFGNGIYKIIAGYNDSSNEKPAWCDVLLEGK